MENKHIEPKVWFTADVHFYHKSILKFVPQRVKALNLNLDDENVISKHNDAMIKLWNKTVNKHDTVYILGDLSFGNQIETKKILEKLNGKKHLIIGNHDGNYGTLHNYFVSVALIKDVLFKKSMYPFLDSNLHCVLCHYPMVAWNGRMHGSVMLHGHTHNSISQFNKDSEELRVDVGFDSDLAQCNLIDLETLYAYLKNDIAKGDTFQNHIKYVTEKCGFKA